MVVIVAIAVTAVNYCELFWQRGNQEQQICHGHLKALMYRRSFSFDEQPSIVENEKVAREPQELSGYRPFAELDFQGC